MSAETDLREPERSWLVRVDKDLAPLAVDIGQVYLSAGDPQFRLRWEGNSFILTAKAGPKTDRLEIETSLSEENGREIWFALVGSPRIRKRRIREDGWEVDIFGGPLAGLCVMERERPEESLPSFPSWVYVIREVTGDARFENRNLACLAPPEAARFVREVCG